MRMIAVMDSGEIKEIAMTAYDRPANAYAVFEYGWNGRTKEEAEGLAEEAVKQLRREEAEYRRE